MTQRRWALWAGAIVAPALCGLPAPVQADPATTAWRYQGRLEFNGTPQNDIFDFIFEAWTQPVGGVLLGTDAIENLPVTDGLFTAEVDFGPGVLNGQRVWLQIEVRPGASGGSFTPLSPRQEILPAPNAQALSGGLDTAYDNNPSITIDASGPVTITGQGTLEGDALEVLTAASVPTIQLTSNRAGFGGSIDLHDEAGVPHMCLESDVSGTGGFLAVHRSQFASAFQLDGNASGTEEPRLSLIGSTRLVEFDFTETTNDGAVLFPVDAINATEIVNEAGVASVAANTNVSIPSASTVDLSARTITAPSAGFVLAIATAQANLAHSTGDDTIIDFGVSDMSMTLPANQDVAFLIPSGLATDTYIYPVTVHGLFQVAAGSHTFYFVGQAPLGDSASVNDVQFTLAFFPTAYGAVEPTLEPLPGAGLTDAEAPLQSPLTPAQIQQEREASVTANESRVLLEMEAFRAEFVRRMAELEKQLAQQEGGGQ